MYLFVAFKKKVRNIVRNILKRKKKMSKPKTWRNIEIQEVSVADIDRLGDNELSEKIIGKQNRKIPGGYVIVPAEYRPDQYYASFTLSGAELIDFVDNVSFSIVTQVDRSQNFLPEIIQRLPDSTRRKAILSGWKNEMLVPDGKLEHIRLSLFGGKVTNAGIEFGNNSCVAIVDGGGRMSTFIEEVNRLRKEDKDLSSHPAIYRNILFHFTFGLSGYLPTMCQEFLLDNSYNKKTSPGQNACVQNAHIGWMERNGRDCIPEIEDNHFATWIVRHLLKDFDQNGSLLSLVGWTAQGIKREDPDGMKKKTVSPLLTILKGKTSKYVRECLKNSSLSIKQLPSSLNDCFHEWYQAMPKLVGEMLSGNPSAPFERMFGQIGLSSLVMIWFSYRKIFKSGTDQFQEFAEAVFSSHLRNNRQRYTSNQNKKVMRINEFPLLCTWFAGDNYNSGAQNSQIFLQEMEAAIGNVLAAWR